MARAIRFTKAEREALELVVRRAGAIEEPDKELARGLKTVDALLRKMDAASAPAVDAPGFAYQAFDALCREVLGARYARPMAGAVISKLARRIKDAGVTEDGLRRVLEWVKTQRSPYFQVVGPERLLYGYAEWLQRAQNGGGGGGEPKRPGRAAGWGLDEE